MTARITGPKKGPNQRKSLIIHVPCKGKEISSNFRPLKRKKERRDIAGRRKKKKQPLCNGKIFSNQLLVWGKRAEILIGHRW